MAEEENTSTRDAFGRSIIGMRFTREGVIFHGSR